MAQSFAPYQDALEVERAHSSPPGTSSHPSYAPGSLSETLTSSKQSHSYQYQPPLPDPSTFDPTASNTTSTRLANLQAFETSIPLRLDWLAMSAYILLPPLFPILLLVFEHKSDFVRFHAWQSAMLFTLLVGLHVIVSASRIVSWLLFGLDLACIIVLSGRAYRDVDTLEYSKVPFIGDIAERWVDQE